MHEMLIKHEDILQYVCSVFLKMFDTLLFILDMYHIARNIGGVKLWQISNLEDQAEI